MDLADPLKAYEYYANVQGLVTLISQRQRGHIKVPDENLRLSSS